MITRLCNIVLRKGYLGQYVEIYSLTFRDILADMLMILL
jgi:hypothetical protein